MITSRDLRIVKKLSALCRENTVALRCAHCAAVVDKNYIISVGFNQCKTDPWFFKESKLHTKQYVHAEHAALKNLKKDLRGNTLYSVRVNQKGDWKNAKPCSICEKIIRRNGINRVIHTVGHGIRELKYE